MVVGVSDKPIVYLDQAHFSTIARAEREGGASDHLVLATRLHDLVGAGKIVCPYSYFHVLETAAWAHDRNREATVSVVGRLSKGICFRAALEILLDELRFVVTRALLGQTEPLTRNVLGMGADVLMSQQIPSADSGRIAELAPDAQFSAVVDWSRKVNLSPSVTNQYNRKLFEYAIRKQRSPSLVTLDAARARMRRGYLNPEGGARGLLALAAQRFRLPFDVLSTIFSAARVEEMPMLAMMAEIEARRYVAFRTQPLLSDGTDDGHLDHLPYARWFLTDHRAAAIARHAGRAVGTIVLSRPRELLNALSSI